MRRTSPTLLAHRSARGRTLARGMALLAAAAGLSTLAATAAAAVEPKVAIPATVAGIWQAIDGQVAQLSDAVRVGKLKTVHVHAFAVRDLAAALPSRAGALPAATRADVKADEHFIATLAERLDATGDANDKAGTEANLGKLQRVLKSLRGKLDAARR